MCKKANRAYRQADHSDETHCIHGVYTGTWCGPDYMCGLCEDGFTSQCPVCKRLTFKKSIRTCAECGRDLWHLFDAIKTNEEIFEVQTYLAMFVAQGEVMKPERIAQIIEKGDRAWKNIAMFGEQAYKLRRRMFKHYVNRSVPR